MKVDDMEVADLVATALAGRDKIEQVGSGYRIAHPENKTTSLTFQAASGASGGASLAAIATVETHLDTADWGEGGVAWLNRRAALGAFFREASGITCRLRYSLYHQDPDARFVATYLIKAFDQQLLTGLGVREFNRNAGGYYFDQRRLAMPRRWITPLPASDFKELVDGLRHYGLVTVSGDKAITLDVPLVEIASARTENCEAARISIRTDVQHPLMGVGYCATMVLPRQPAAESLPRWCADLNALEHEQEDFAPRLGAWGMRNLTTRLVYSLFLATDRAEVIALAKVAHWMVRRAVWIRRNLWAPGVGLVLQGKVRAI